MSSVKRTPFTVTINALVPTVWRLMIGPESYMRWASAFAEGTYFEGSWEPGAKIKFLSPPSGDGMVAEIAENRKNEFISIRHLGFISNGVEDTTREPFAPGRPRTRTTRSAAFPGARSWSSSWTSSASGSST